MKKIEIQKIIDMNYRALMLLGYATSLMDDLKVKDARYKWFIKCIENLVYLDIPLPPCP